MLVDALKAQHELGILIGGQHGDEIIGLKNETDSVPAHPGQLSPPQSRQVAALDPDTPARGNIQSPDQVEDRRFAGP